MQKAIDSKPIESEMRVKMEKYCAELLAFGMQEPSKRESSVWHRNFFKPMTSLTAFIINLTGTDQYVEIVYGYASTAFTRFSGDENALIEWGVSDNDITIREKFIISDEIDEKKARSLITDIYKRYAQTEKDDLLRYAKEKRKAFIQQIAVMLKRLGFKKKANTWTRTLENEYYLMFNAQKSAFSDEYYFNVYMGKNGTNDYGDCYYTRVAPQGMCPMDWQALTKEQIDIFLKETVLPALEKIIDTPLSELGKQYPYWLRCDCKRTKCETCWMEKNKWDLIEEKTYYLPVETTEGLIELELKQKTIPEGEEKVRVVLSTMVQGVLHSYEADTTETVLLALEKNLPEGWKIQSLKQEEKVRRLSM